MSTSNTVSYQRYVAIGDSSTEGLDDPDGRGGYRGWANRLAETIAASQGSLAYANLAIRGRHTRQIRDEQLPRAMAMRPDLVTLFSGTNDVVSRSFPLDEVIRDIEVMQRTIVGSGATLLTFTLPDFQEVLPAARSIATRFDSLNRALREVAESTGALLVDFAKHPVAADPRLWSDDRFHANAAGHARIAAALAHRLGLPGCDDSWTKPLPPRPSHGPLRRLVDDSRWLFRHLLPWLWRHAWGRSSGDGRTCKRPELAPVVLPQFEGAISPREKVKAKPQ